MATARVGITPYLVDTFTTLFRGRADVYGAWGGGCVRKPLTPDTFMGHLQGDELIGVPTGAIQSQLVLCVGMHRHRR